MQNTVVVPNSTKGKRETYEFHWTIPNWKSVSEDANLVNNQSIILKTDPSPRFQTKWAIGLKAVPHPANSYLFLVGKQSTRMYWKLLEIKEPQQKLTVRISLQVLAPITGIPECTNTITQQVKLEDIVEISSYFLVKPNILSTNSSLIDSDGSVKYALRLTLESLENYQLERFLRKSNQQMCKNLEALLTDDCSGDVKIVTSEGATIVAHKNILKVQCPVFAAMFNFENLESSNGLVKVDDVSEKVMKILVHYFYTGNLLESWCDEDIIVEFTYAAGKYQMVQVLELLDDLLGTEIGGGGGGDVEISYCHVQLLSLAGKLGLRNGEMRLLQQIKDKINKVEGSEELFKLFGFGFEQGKNLEGWGKVGDFSEGNNEDKLEVSMGLKIVDYALGNLEYEELFNRRGLQVLALGQKFALKNVEKILLKRFAETASTVECGDELFEIFGYGK